MSIIDYYLVRHAPVAGAREHLYKSGNEPANLSDAVSLDWLADQLPDHAQWFSSPLQRTRQTADALRERKPGSAELTSSPQLTEQDFGDWYGLDFDHLWPKIKRLPPHNWSLLAAHSLPPGGEAFTDVCERASHFMKDQTGSGSSTPRVIITHAGVIRAILGYCLGLSPDLALNFALDTLSLTHLQYSPKDFHGGHWRLVRLNHTGAV
ncbi:histidine phosphatase family protein [Emcibacter nanhaiensis]|uniref:Histidine phosphatase family protein n=1 Tax=Emcibacter nanhaiensis TaxID=1505037 RepID=A0A501PJJ4_9PROT|nr:histidine phosphatase family protein [Emcibacter nanhaiensis]TPD60639.1 histidine phosphatase family protein [Emcibacter nanhaiensis]